MLHTIFFIMAIPNPTFCKTISDSNARFIIMKVNKDKSIPIIFTLRKYILIIWFAPYVKRYIRGIHIFVLEQKQLQEKEDL